MVSFEDLRERFAVEYEKMREYYAATGFSFSFEVFLAGFALLALLIAIVLLLLNLSLFEVVVAFFAVMSFSISIPITMRENRIAEIESNLPDALKHMALVLKAGGTVENALEEVALPDGYGSLGADFKKALGRLRRGQSFESVLVKIAEESGSLLLRRTASIIVDARRAGAGLADVLFAISDDAKDVLHIQRERLSRTVMHAIFIASSSIIIAPFIFGFALSVINFIAVNMLKALPNAKAMDVCSLNTTFVLFLVIQTIVAAVALGIVRFGKTGKYLLYLPVLVLISLLIFETAKWLSNVIVGGTGLVC
ncbi:MAG: type II secretion system F family protein [Candidatus Norongarragalinales archaeon]